jgi:hypothetical protein
MLDESTAARSLFETVAGAREMDEVAFHDAVSRNLGYIRDLVPKKGLEPPHPCEYMDLNHARLPIPPLRHGLSPGQGPPGPAVISMFSDAAGSVKPASSCAPRSPLANPVLRIGAPGGNRTRECRFCRPER